MSQSTEDRIAAIRRNVSLPDLLLSYGVALRKAGSGFVAKCISHDDKNPSMSIFPAKDGDGHRCYCHACGFGNDVIDAYQQLTGVDFNAALDALDGGEYHGQKWAVIKNEPPLQRPERDVFPPPADAPPPPFHKANYKNDDGEWVPMGAPVGTWCYSTPEGAPWYYEARYEVDGRKEPRCWTWGKRGSQPARWELGFPPKPRPLYGLNELADATQVLICEGPRKAEAARKLLNGTKSIACIGWPGGANGVKNADWTPLEGRALLLMPDNDAPGIAAMHGVAALANPGKVHLIDTSAMPEGWDAADAVAEGWDKVQFVAFLKANKREYSPPIAAPEPEPPPMAFAPIGAYAEPIAPFSAPIQDLSDHEWGEPIDLFEEFSVAPLRRGLLPAVIENHVFDLAECINADPAYGAITALSAVAGLLDDRIKIRINEGFSESARLWTMCVGEPSSKKSPMMDAVLMPVAAIAKKVAQEDKKTQQRQEILDARHKAKLKEYTEASIKSDDHSVEEPIPPQRLERKRVKCDNLTREALEEILRDMPSGVFLHADELSGWIGSLDAYKQNGVNSDRPLWLRAFGGGPMQVDRIGRGSYLIDNWSVTISGGIQPSKLAALSGKLDDDGLLQRFLIVTSNRDGGQGAERPRNHAYAEAWRETLEQIADTKPGGGHVTMTPEAYGILRQFGAELYEIINSRMISRAFTTALGKWEGVSARMVLIYHAIECATRRVHPGAVPVEPETAAMACDYMMRHLLPHMISFYEDGIGKSEIAAVTKLIAGLIVAEGTGEITTTKLKQYGPAAFRALGDKQVAVLSRLVEYNWLQPRNQATSLIRHPTRYLVNPAVHELFARHKQIEAARLESRREIARKIKAGGDGR